MIATRFAASKKDLNVQDAATRDRAYSRMVLLQQHGISGMRALLPVDIGPHLLDAPLPHDLYNQQGVLLARG